MKVRHKQLRIEFAVKPFRGSVYIGDALYYETEGGSFIAHTDPQWEVCDPPEQWIDVTADCESQVEHGWNCLMRKLPFHPSQIPSGGGSLSFGSPTAHNVILEKHDDGSQYRLRKVRALIEGTLAGSAEYKSAFIVEKRS